MKVIPFCGKKNCCPEFVKENGQIALRGDDGTEIPLTTDQFVSLVFTMKQMKSEELVDFIQ